MNDKEKSVPSEKKQTVEMQQGVKEKDNRHNRDISSKTVFANPVLCAQFLRDNFDMPVLKGVQPEDIEDVSERYYPYLGTEFNSDSVKKIRILDIEKGKKEPPFLVSLIEHKSLVDYDVPMQMLRYMVCIWTEYRREMEAAGKGSTRQKGFRYPVIIPIVYYEGKAEWTADRHLCDRIRDNLEFREWIPDFRYEVVRIHDFTDRELLERENEMSLIMLINKIQSAADLEQFMRIPADKLNRIVQDSPEHIVDILVSVMENLCFKIDVSTEERMQCVRKVKEREMGYLFENMEKFSIQEERKKTEAQKKKTEEERRKTEEERQKAEEERRKAEEQRKRADAAEEKLRLAEEMIRRLKENQKS